MEKRFLWKLVVTTISLTLLFCLFFDPLLKQKTVIKAKFHQSSLEEQKRSRPTGVAFVGFKKCGTGALKDFLREHPSIKVIPTSSCEPGAPEVSYVNKEVEWVLKRDKIPIVSENRCSANIKEFDKLQRIGKIIMIVRNPVERAYSDYKHTCHMEPWIKMPSFKEIVAEAIDDLTKKQHNDDFREYMAGLQYGNKLHTIVAKGIYYEFIKEFYKRYEEKNILVLSEDELKSDPAAVLQKVESFLSLPHTFSADRFERNNKTAFYCIKKSAYPYLWKCHEKKPGKGKKCTILPDEESLKKLRNFYLPYNEKLFSLTKQTFNWN